MFLLYYMYTLPLSDQKPHVKEWKKKCRREKENFDENHFNLDPSPNPNPLKKFPGTNGAQGSKAETMVKEHSDRRSWAASQNSIAPQEESEAAMRYSLVAQCSFCY